MSGQRCASHAQAKLGAAVTTSDGGGRLQTRTQAMHLKCTTTRSCDSAGAEVSIEWQMPALARTSIEAALAAGIADSAICSSSARVTIQLVDIRSTAPIQADSLRTASDRLGRRACAAAARAFTPFRNALSTFVPSLCEEQVITATKVQQYGEVMRYRSS